MSSPVLRRANADDLPAIAALLSSAHLPQEGVADHLGRFFVLENEHHVIGAIGLEVYGPDALLRSAVIADEFQSQGLGTLLYGRVLEEAAALHVRRLVLLTTTAEKFFQKFGFRQIPRDTISGPITASAEFRGACPSTAVCMEKQL